ncbi:MAG: hypothetical protein AAGK21_02435 [Bacteroidota bacterium]
MRFALLAFLSLTFVACDSASIEQGDPFVYATDGTDGVSGLIRAPNGDLVVVGSSEGIPRPADGTLALPTVLRFSETGTLRSAEVYRDIGFGRVVSAAFLGDELAVTAYAGPDDIGSSQVVVYRTDGQGRRVSELLRPRAEFAPVEAFVGLEDGSAVVAVRPESPDAPSLYRIDASGRVAWSERPGGLRVSALAPAPAGDVYLLGQRVGVGPVVARVRGNDGSLVWSLDWDNTATPERLAATSAGVAVLENRRSLADGSSIRVVPVSSSGAVGTPISVASAPGSADGTSHSERSLRGTSLADLGGGRFAVAYTESGRDIFTAPDAWVVTASAQGVSERQRFGVEGRWVDASSMLRLLDGRLAVAGSVGPEQISGYGGDDFDIVVRLYDIR